MNESAPCASAMNDFPTLAAEVSDGAANADGEQVDWRPFGARAPTPIAPPQFGLRGLMIATGLIAAFFGLARLINIWALLLALIAFFVVRLADLAKGERPSAAKQWVYDLLTGVLLPIGCLVYDPFFFHEPSVRGVAFAIFGSQMLVLFGWMLSASRFGTAAFGFVAGFLSLGALVAIAVAMFMTPFTMIGFFVLIGAVGLVPFFTAATFFRHAARAWQRAGRGRTRTIAATTGFLAALAIPIAAWAVMDYVPKQWLRPPRVNSFLHFN